MSDVVNKHWPAWTWTKRALLGLIVTIQGIALYSSELPYFPIEVSRTAATTTLNRYLFPSGVVALPAVARFVDGAPWAQLQHYVLAWAGLVCVAWYDDVQYPVAHVISVLVMVMGLVRARHQNTTHRLMRGGGSRTSSSSKITNLIESDDKLFVHAVALYCWRGVMKTLAVTQLEGVAWWPIDIVKYCVAIGQGVLRPSSVTLNVFRLCGALQWGVFYMLSSVLP